MPSKYLLHWARHGAAIIEAVKRAAEAGSATVEVPTHGEGRIELCGGSVRVEGGESVRALAAYLITSLDAQALGGRCVVVEVGGGSLRLRADRSSCSFLDRLDSVVASRLAEKREDSYTWRLASRGVAAVARKLGEEAIEAVLAGVGEADRRVVEEAADLVYHLVVLLRVRGLSMLDVCEELARRHLKREAER